MLLPVAFFLAASAAKAEPDQDEWSNYPEFTGEACAKLPPSEFCGRFEKKHEHSFSMGTTDDFHHYYEQVLGDLIDRRFPNARWYHAELKAAFLSMMEYVGQIAAGQNTGHSYERSGAFAEWYIYQGENTHYRLPQKLKAGSGLELEMRALHLKAAQHILQNEYSSPRGLVPLHASIDHFLAATAEEKGSIYPDMHRSRFYANALANFLDDETPFLTTEADGKRN